MSISISWNETSKPNGIIIDYLVEISVTSEASVQHKIWLGHDSRGYKYQVSVLCRNYLVMVAPKTAAGTANFSTKYIIANAPGMTLFKQVLSSYQIYFATLFMI